MAITWSNLDDWSVRATCTTGTETPSGATAGLNLASGTDNASRPVRYVEIHVKPTTASTAITAGTIDIYSYNPFMALWNKVGSYDVAAQSNDIGVALPAMEVAPVGRMAAVPTGLGVAVTLDMYGTPEAP